MRTLLLVIATAVSSVPLLVSGYTDGAVPGRAGGFGGATCLACHADNPVNAPGGELHLRGLPDVYTPGQVYRITVELARGELTRGGFSLAARFSEGPQLGRQAGQWRIADPRLAVYADAQTGVPFVQHSTSGTRTPTPGTIQWELEWVAPRDAGPVQVNAAANASNDDASPLGDFVYVLETIVKAPRDDTAPPWLLSTRRAGAPPAFRFPAWSR